MDLYEIRRKNLRALMKSRFNGKQALLAAALDRPANYISRCLSSSLNPASRKNIGEDFARDIEGRLGLERYQMDSADLRIVEAAPAVIEEGSNVAPMLQPYREEKEYPLISWIAAGGWAESCDNFQPGDAEEWIASDVNAGPRGYWLTVKGPSMVDPSGHAVTSFPPGMHILVQPEGFDVISGKFYIARRRVSANQRETTFKQYIRDAGIGYLQPLNPSFQTMLIDDDVEIIGRVVDARLPKTAL